MNKILHGLSLRKTFFGGSAVLMATTIVSYALGLLRDRIFANTFGASATLDAYNAAFILPDLILNIFVAGALSAALVPILSHLESPDRQTERNDFINSVINGSLLMVLASGVLVFIFAPQLAQLIVPGFDEVARQLFINLTRLLLISPLIFAISNTLGNVIVSREKFFWFGISAAMYNVGIILGAVFLTPTMGIYGVVVGTIIGAFLHLLSRLIGFSERGFRYQTQIKYDQNYKRFFKIMLPKMIGHPVEQVTFLAFTAMASILGAGSIVVLNFARNFQSMPVATVGINLALAAFPMLSRAASQNSSENYKKELHLTTRSILAITIPVAGLMYMLRHPIISILLGGGAFDEEAIRLTAATLGVFTLSIPTESLSHLLARGFYALKNSLTPTIMGVAGLGAAVGFGYLFARTMGVPGLALGFVIGSALKTLGLWLLLGKEAKKLQN